MGKIVKSIGKAIKKVGKGLKKIIKKIGPVLLIAAAVYAGVAFYGASLSTTAAATGIGKLSVTNFMAGLTKLGENVMGFMSPGGAGTAGAGGGSLTGQALLNAGNVASGSGNVLNIAATSGSAFTGSVTSQAGANAIRTFVSAANTTASGMTTGDALVYMTKWNMIRTGAEMAAGLFTNKEKELFEQQKELLEMRYSYGAPSTDEQKSFLAANPNYFTGGTQGAAPALQSSQTMAQVPAGAGMQQANLASQITPPSPYVRQQTIGQPTFGRRSTTQFETPARRTAMAGQPGLITQAAKTRRFT